MPSLPAFLVRLPARTLFAVALWAGLVGFGFHRALSFSGTPGAPTAARRAWPAGVELALDLARPTLVLAAHPRCPCTRATLGELDRLVARCGDRLAIHVLFYSDPALGAGWEQSDLWDHARAIPGVDVVSDPLGRTAARFGAVTSGHAFLYAPSGELLFDGGLTLARGHAGDNPGTAALAALACGEPAATRATPVFGCALGTEPLAAELPRP